MDRDVSEPAEIRVERDPARYAGAVPKPSALIALQVVAGLLVVGGLFALAMTRLLDTDPKWSKFPLLLASYGLVVALFAIVAAWKRPPGLVAGMVALAMLMVTFPIGTVLASIVGFLAIKNREHVRDYYSQTLRGRRG